MVKPLKIQVVSDIVCPWCAIGYYRMKAALAERPDIVADIGWQAFELNPHMAKEGENLREHLAAKYGTTPEGSKKARANLTALGQEVGFTFAYADDQRMWNTFDAHRLLYWAGSVGDATPLKTALLDAYFGKRENVSDHEVLIRVAESVGLDADDARKVLENGRFAAEVRAEEDYWKRAGVQGVPAFIFDQRFILSGAQPKDVFHQVFDKLSVEAA